MSKAKNVISLFESKAFSLYVNKKVYGVFATEKEAKKIQKEIKEEGDGVDVFSIKKTDYEGKELPWFNKEHPDRK